MFSNAQRKALEELVKRAALDGVADALASCDPGRTCLDCVHFREHAGELCALYGARPPARVIVSGCVSWELDLTPF